MRGTVLAAAVVVASTMLGGAEFAFAQASTPEAPVWRTLEAATARSASGGRPVLLYVHDTG